MLVGAALDLADRLDAALNQRGSRGANVCDDEADRHAAARVLGPVGAREQLEQFAFDNEPDRAFADVALRKAEHVAVEAPLRLQVVANDADPNRPTQLP